MPSRSQGFRSSEQQRKFTNAWKPNGKGLPDTADEMQMSFELASNILRTGAYFKKKAGRRSSVSRYFFVGDPSSPQGFLKYFRDHKAVQTPRGGFELVDLVRREVVSWVWPEAFVGVRVATLCFHVFMSRVVPWQGQLGWSRVLHHADSVDEDRCLGEGPG